jgi:hypothetical protein
MARLFANENLPEPVVFELRRLGHDVVTMRDSGHAGLAVPDTEVLEFAIAHSRAVITLNAPLRQAPSPRPAHAGIVVCSFDPDFTAPARRIHEAVEPYPDLAGTLIRVNRSS